MNRTARFLVHHRNLVAVGLCGLLAIAILPTAARSQYAKKGAGIGALLGLALGSGNVLVDVASGAALGAAGGGIANMATEGKRSKKADRERYEAQQAAELAERERRAAEQERRWAEQEVSARERELLERERQLADRERLAAQTRVQLEDALQSRDDAEMAIIQVIGPDVWEGYKSLRGCQFERASAMAQVGYTSNDMNHKLGALWLEAMTAVDSRNEAAKKEFFDLLVQYDPEIDTVQQASLAADQAVLDMRSERRELGIKPCN